MKTSDNKGQWVVQRVKTRDNELQRMTTSGTWLTTCSRTSNCEWQRVIILADFVISSERVAYQQASERVLSKPIGSPKKGDWLRAETSP